MAAATAIDFQALWAEEKAKLRRLKLQAKKKKKPKVKLEKFSVLPDLFYIPDYLTLKEQKTLVSSIQKSSSAWVQLSKRRLQNWGGVPHPSGMFEEMMPLWLDNIATDLVDRDVFEKKPNQCLLNEYVPPKGIGLHNDGPLYVPKVAILSLQSSAIIQFLPHESGPPVKLILEPGSLMIFEKSFYTDYDHFIEDVAEDVIDENVANMESTKHAEESTIVRDSRLSLTLRSVKKVAESLGTEEEQHEKQRRKIWWQESISEKADNPEEPRALISPDLHGF